MISKKTLRRNSLIAIFMGYKGMHKINSIGRYTLFRRPNDTHWRTVYDFDYHKSWDSLMPVIEKCYDLALKFKSKSPILIHSIDATDFFHIDRMHEIVVEFIREYNAQNKK